MAERSHDPGQAASFKSARSRGKGRFDGCLGAVVTYIWLWAPRGTGPTRRKRKRRHGMVDPRSLRSLRWHGSDELPVGGNLLPTPPRLKPGGVFSAGPTRAPNSTGRFSGLTLLRLLGAIFLPFST